MDLKPVTLLEPAGSLSPLVVDSPHSGRRYPDDFGYACPLPLLRQTEDFMVDFLMRGAVQAGATVIIAEFPRSYIDTNRAENDIDPAVLAEAWDAPLQLTERTALGLGLVRRLCMAGVPMYATPLSVAEVQKRIRDYYVPYHAALDQALQRRIGLFGVCYLLNCHSMPSRGQDEVPVYRPDFILGDRNGSSCDPSLTAKVSHLLQEMGYSVALNEPYKGMEIVRRYGVPQSGRHALQIEINRRLYMDERKLELHEGAVELQRNLTAMLRMLASSLQVVAEPLAAE
jgi:N-formylglutamate amidohydrolase